MEIEDAFKIRKWGRHEDPLLIDYELGTFSTSQLKIWYLGKKSGIRNKYFAIYDEENNMIGYLGIKDIGVFKKTSTLGIVLDPNYVSKGYGYKIMEIFLKYYFDILKMKEMTLEVNSFNERAVKLYKNIGFKYVTEYLGMFENQDIDLTSSEYKKYKDNFLVNKRVIYSKNYVMKLTYIGFISREKKDEI